MLELGALGLDFELFITVESGSVFAEDARLCVHSGTTGTYSCSRCDLKSRLWPVLAIEGGSVGLVGRPLRSHLGLISEESSIIVLVSLAVHIGGDNTILHTLELDSNCVTCVQFCLGTPIKEGIGSCVILRGRIGNLVLEESLLSLLEVRVFFDSCRDSLHGVFASTTITTSLVELVIAELVDFGVLVCAIELSI